MGLSAQKEDTCAYTLTTVDGAALPFTALDLGAYRAKLVSGTLSLSSDGTYALQLGIRIDERERQDGGRQRWRPLERQRQRHNASQH